MLPSPDYLHLFGIVRLCKHPTLGFNNKPHFRLCFFLLFFFNILKRIKQNVTKQNKMKTKRFKIKLFLRFNTSLYRGSLNLLLFSYGGTLRTDYIIPSLPLPPKLSPKHTNNKHVFFNQYEMVI